MLRLGRAAAHQSDYNPAHHGVHLLDLNKTPAPPVYELRYQEVSA
jgi:hypothetical protein